MLRPFGKRMVGNRTFIQYQVLPLEFLLIAKVKYMTWKDHFTYFPQCNVIWEV